MECCSIWVLAEATYWRWHSLILLQNIIEKVQDAATDLSNAIQDKMPAGTQPGGVGRKPGDEWTQLSSTGELNPAKKEAAEKNNPDGLDVMVCRYPKISTYYHINNLILCTP